MHVGVFGCGQLARMLALAGWPQAIRFSFAATDGENSDPVNGLGAVVPIAADASAAEIYSALGRPDVITVERESVDVRLLRELQQYCDVHPNPDAVRACQNRRLERELLDRLNIRTAPHRCVRNIADVPAACAELGLPVVVKTAESGYDGKNQWRLYQQPDIDAFVADHSDGDYLIERFVEFEREVSVVAARSGSGEFRRYPTTENLHRDGILLASSAPAANLADGAEEVATRYARFIMEDFDYVGVLAVECFVVGDELWVNELAPRVHNSGHWTQSADVASQFENHLRAITGSRLGDTLPTQYHGMVNLLGQADRHKLLPLLSHSTELHLYNKTARPGRKLGHINVRCRTRSELTAEVQRLMLALHPALPISEITSGDSLKAADDLSEQA